MGLDSFHRNFLCWYSWKVTELSELRSRVGNYWIFIFWSGSICVQYFKIRGKGKTSEAWTHFSFSYLLHNAYPTICSFVLLQKIDRHNIGKGVYTSGVDNITKEFVVMVTRKRISTRNRYKTPAQVSLLPRILFNIIILKESYPQCRKW